MSISLFKYLRDFTVAFVLLRVALTSAVLNACRYNTNLFFCFHIIDRETIPNIGFSSFVVKEMKGIGWYNE